MEEAEFAQRSREAAEAGLCPDADEFLLRPWATGSRGGCGEQGADGSRGRLKQRCSSVSAGLFPALQAVKLRQLKLLRPWFNLSVHGCTAAAL